MKRLLLGGFLLCILNSASAQGTFQPSNSLTTTEKIYGFSKFWEEVSYNFVYFDKIGTQKWDSTYIAMLPSVMEAKNDWEYYQLLKRFSAVLNDGHTGIMRSPITLDQAEPKKDGNAYLPERNNLFKEGHLALMEVENTIIVSVVNKNLAERIPLGSEIIEVNNLPVNEYIEKYTLPFVSNSTDYMKRFESIRAITNGCYGEELKIGIIKPNGKKAIIDLTFGGTTYKFPEGIDSYVDEKEWKLFNLKWLENEIVHIELNSFSDKKIIDHFKEALPEIRKAKGIVIDIRNNGGGSTNNGSAILEYLTPDDKLYGSKSKTRQYIASYKAWGSFITEKDTIGNEWATKSYLAKRDLLYYDLGQSIVEVRPQIDDRIIVPTAILVGNFTASAAEDFLIYADNQKHMTRIGDKSYGSTGQPIVVSLGKGFSARICTKDDTYPDGRPFIGVGVIPHIEVKQSLKDYKENKDVVLEKAIEHLMSKIK